MTRRRTILLGNGFNRCAANAPSWCDLMEAVARNVGTNATTEGVPLPLVFERLGARSLAGGIGRAPKSYDELKDLIAKEINGINYADDAACRGLYESLHKIKFDDLITTNYDMTYERVVEASSDASLVESSSLGSGRRYLLPPTGTIGTRRIFHAHGIAKYPRTICVGYEHYLSTVAQLRDRLFPTRAQIENGAVSIEVLSKLHDPIASNWGASLLLNDVAIVGLGLNFDELDLWWLLCLRQGLYRNAGSDPVKGNAITYFKIVENNVAEANADRVCETLRELDVNVVLVTKNDDDYAGAYKEIIDILSKEWGMG